MNDLEYRRKQLLKLQDAVIDLEDLSRGVSITDLTLNDFRVDPSNHLKQHPGALCLRLGTYAVTTQGDDGGGMVPPGVISCLRAVGQAALKGGDTTVVFRDDAFADDMAKTNLTAILQQHGLENVRSL